MYRDGIHVSLPAGAHCSRHAHSSDAGHAKFKVLKQKALAESHARALEQLIDLFTSSAAVIIGRLRQQKKISHKQVTQLKGALLDAKLAKGILGELRIMDINDARLREMLSESSLQLHSRADQESSPAKDALRAVSEQQTGMTARYNNVELHVSRPGFVYRTR